jgi:hypothetical protein
VPVEPDELLGAATEQLDHGLGFKKGLNGQSLTAVACFVEITASRSTQL